MKVPVSWLREYVPLDMPLPSDAGYYLVAPDAVANDEPFVALSRWLLSLVPHPAQEDLREPDPREVRAAERAR